MFELGPYFSLKIELVKKQIEKEFNNFSEVFSKYLTDKWAYRFIDYYNKTVLDRSKVKFKEFINRWALRGITKEFYSYFDDNYYSIKSEIETKRNFAEFYAKYFVDTGGKNQMGIRIRGNQGSFCSKLWHTFLPKEYPPVDNPIRKRFNLHNEGFINSIFILKGVYEKFIKENPEKMDRARRVLSENKFSKFRVNEVSDIRILDMFFWILNREGG